MHAKKEMQVLDLHARIEDSGSQKQCSVKVNKPVFSHLSHFLTNMVTPENSSAIDRAPGARSKSVELSGVTIMVHPLHSRAGARSGFLLTVPPVEQEEGC
jgi:hypothetical protein